MIWQYDADEKAESSARRNGNSTFECLFLTAASLLASVINDRPVGAQWATWVVVINDKGPQLASFFLKFGTLSIDKMFAPRPRACQGRCSLQSQYLVS